MIIVLGATGLIGGYLAKLLDAQKTPMRLVGRNEARLKSLGLNADARAGDLDDPAGLDHAFRGGEQLFLLSAHSDTMEQQQINAIEAAKRQGIRHIVKVSGSSQSISPDNVSQMGQQHYRIEQALKASGVDYTILRPTFFMQNLLDMPATFVKNGRPIVMPFKGTQQLTFVDAQDIATVAAHTLQSEEYIGQELEVIGDEATFNDLATYVSKAVGRSVRYQGMPIWVTAIALRLRGTPAWQRRHQLQMAKLFGAQGDIHNPTDIAPLLGRKPVSLAAFIEANADAFRPDA